MQQTHSSTHLWRKQPHKEKTHDYRPSHLKNMYESGENDVFKSQFVSQYFCSFLASDLFSFCRPVCTSKHLLYFTVSSDSLSAVSGVMFSYCWWKHNVYCAIDSCCFYCEEVTRNKTCLWIKGATLLVVILWQYCRDWDKCFISQGHTLKQVAQLWW